MRKIRFGACALVATALLGAVPGTAWAPRVKLLPASGSPCMVDLEKGTFVGTFSLQSFSVQNGVAMATGGLTGTCSTADADVATPGGLVVSVPFKIPAASCDSITLELGEATFANGSSKMAVTLPQATLTADPKQVRGQMCAFAQQLRVRPLTALVAELNRIFARLS